MAKKDKEIKVETPEEPIEKSEFPDSTEEVKPSFREGSKKEQELYEEIKLQAKRLEALIAQAGENEKKQRVIDTLNILIKQLTA